METNESEIELNDESAMDLIDFSEMDLNDDFVDEANDDFEEVVYRTRPSMPSNANNNEGNLNKCQYGNIYKKKIQEGAYIELNDSHVVPYNPYLSLKYGCHINLEWTQNQKCCQYIFKYITKGLYIFF